MDIVMLTGMDEEMLQGRMTDDEGLSSVVCRPSYGFAPVQVVVFNRTDEWGDFHKVWAGSDNGDDFTILHFLKQILMCHNLVNTYKLLIISKMKKRIMRSREFKKWVKLNFNFSYGTNPVDSACAGMKRP